MMRHKGTYPYEYMDHWDRFEERKLPPKEAFLSKLNISDITDQEYEHAHNVWNALKINTMGEYHDIYLKTDVLLLSDVFETF